MNPSFWKGKKVFVTGHTGFQGSWLCLWLQGLGAKLIGYSLPPPTHPSLFKLAQVDHEMMSLQGDVRHLKALEDCIHETRPEIVFHLAAQSLVGLSYQSPVETYATNILGSVNLLEAIRKNRNVKAAVLVTSDKCYENNGEGKAYREDDRLGGGDPYSSSKAGAELAIAAYRRSFFQNNPDDESPQTGIASARAGNVIGGGDWSPHRLVPDIMKALLEKKPILLRNPDGIRPWQHVLDALHGYLLLAEKLWEDRFTFAKAWNFGPSPQDSRSVSWMTEKLIEFWKAPAAWERLSNDHPREDHILKLENTQAQSLLDWKPRLSLTAALEWIAQWYRAYQKNEKMREFTQTQILNFQNQVIG